jgi:cytochrome bd-type quinol oxidase subunit 2
MVMDVKRDTFKVIWMKMMLLIAPLVIIAMSFMVSLAKDYTSTGTTLAVLLIMLLANYQVFSSLYPILAKITLNEEKVTIKYPFWGKEKTFNYS